MQPLSRHMGLYIHWPFCAKKCPYCDFNSHVRDVVDGDAFLAAFRAELASYAAMADSHQLVSIFFGGGTPSLMPAEVTRALIDEATSLFNVHADDLEITLEANPNSVEAAKFAAFRQAGVNRVSVGVQSLRDDALKFLGRLHGVDEAKAAVTLARQNFDRYSFDLIYARPDQTLDMWRDELAEALDMAGDHLSLYQLTIEPGTAFQGAFQKGKLILPDEDLAADLYDLTQEMTTVAGLPQYEISNHARLGLESIHNMGYWQGRAYIGLGAGAHGRLPIADGRWITTQNFKKPEHWMRAVTENGRGIQEEAMINADDRAEEMVLMGLRTREGLDKTLFVQLSGQSLDDIVSNDAVADLVAEGLLINQPDRLMLTARGRPLLDGILRHILT